MLDSRQTKALAPDEPSRVVGHALAQQAYLPHLRLFVAITAVLIAFSAIDSRIVSGGNLWNIAIQTSYIALFAMAQTIVLLTRGFDLSLGVTVSVVSVLSAMVITGANGPHIALAVLAGFGTGLGVGVINGILIAGAGINPLVATLGMANILLALASTISGGFPVPGVSAAFTEVLSTGRVLAIPTPMLIGLVAFAGLYGTLRYTVFGRSLYIIGANPRAARAAGIRSMFILIAAYALCSTLAAMGALLLTARTGSGEPNLGGNLTLESIAAAVVGGVRLTGGDGGVGGALLGALFITVLSNVMNLAQIDGYLQQILLGLIIIASLIAGRDKGRR